MNPPLSPGNSVKELQGLYGPLRILEGKIQQVWALQEVQPGRWQTRCGKPLEVVDPGIWNRGAGPDFKEAVLRLDGRLVTGDVEIHLYREDWWRHGHHLDPAYNHVVLHVVLFAGGMDRDILTQSGKSPEEWKMGPWMREDLESVSGGHPGLFGEVVPELQEWIESDLPERIRDRLRIGAERRLQNKGSMARCFLDHFGWEGALHRITLYYLGFPYNRRSFYELAERYPPGWWQSEGDLETIKAEWSDRIKWANGRPANNAEARLGQYFELESAAPGWTSRLKAVPIELKESLKAALRLPGMSLNTASLRGRACFPGWRRWVREEVLSGILTGSLVDRLWIDAFLPLMITADHLSTDEGYHLWFHGYNGAFPDTYPRLLKLAGVHLANRRPLCNGWTQGLIWAEDQLRMERVRSTMGHVSRS